MEFFDCENCNGRGVIPTDVVEKIEVSSISNPGYKMFIPGMEECEPCKVCNGVGKIDWIQKIRRKGEYRNV